MFATAYRMGVRAKPHVYACTHLANTASLLLPVSNLTNLLAFTASGLSFVAFGAVMALPWLVSIAVEFVVLRLMFGSDLRVGAGEDPGDDEAPDTPPVPVFTLVVLALMFVGFGVASVLGVEPVWVGLAGLLVLAGRALLQRRTTVGDLVDAASPLFCLFVLALSVVVAAVVDHGLGALLGAVLPHGAGLLALLTVAGIAALLANLINNLPAILALLPLLASAGPGPILAAVIGAIAAVLANVVNNLPATLALVPLVAANPASVLAMLLGVNIGPNATYPGSLATLLWRRILQEHDHDPGLGEFTRVGLVTALTTIAGATVSLWAVLLVGG